MFVYYDVEKLARTARITTSDFDRLAKEVRQEFPDDEMMFELHLMRAIKAACKTDSLQALKTPCKPS